MKHDCSRCGNQCLSVWAYEKAIERGKTPLCVDCQTTRLLRVQYDDDYCVPHQGLFDDNDTPINNDGLVIYPDVATCGHSDCVRLAHHVEPALVEFSQPKHKRRQQQKTKPVGRQSKLVVKEIKTPKRSKTQVWDLQVIMALAEIQDFNHKQKIKKFSG